MTEYRVGQEGASVFDADGRLLARLGPGAVVVPGTLAATVGPRPPGAADDEPATVAPRYADKVIRPQRGPAA